MPSSSQFYADLHIHSKYSRACSRDCDLEHLAWWGRRKGITLLGTGDFTHPAWFAQLNELLVQAEPGLYRLNDDLQQHVDARLPKTCQGPIRFMLSVEISTIYKRDNKTRKVHHLIYLPDFAAAQRFNRTLSTIGNLGSDGRPILGLDSRDLLEITLTASPDGYLIPAHIWTPWFAALGSKSGFDAIADCYVDLADHIFAVETGLSSDPAMNWRVSSLDSYTLVSNSDAHSPPALGREATMLQSELDYYEIRQALIAGGNRVGTVEFFPEEGKYHLDGHRACEVRWEPSETRHRAGICPTCGKPVTVGVLHRVETLADRNSDIRPTSAGKFQNLVPLPEILGEIRGRGPRTKGVLTEWNNLVATLGPELEILTKAPIDDIARASDSAVTEAITRLRAGNVIRESGYDGEYGVIRLFAPDELADLRSGTALFALPALSSAFFPALRAKTPPGDPHCPEKRESELEKHQSERAQGRESVLDTEQEAAAHAPDGPLLIVAGPGTGKTRTLVHRISHLIQDRGVSAEHILAITFTRRAAGELAERLGVHSAQVAVATFHALALRILQEQHQLLGLAQDFRIAEDADRSQILAELLGAEATAQTRIPEDLQESYQKALRVANLVDLDELVSLAVQLCADEQLARHYQQRWQWVFVDEYQDVDEAQYRLLRALVPPSGNLCAIGDPDQAIYGFRGADVRFFLQFSADYPTARTVELHRNYRSVAPIVRAANQVIGPHSLVPNRQFTPTHVGGQRSAPGSIHVYEAQTARDEAAHIVQHIEKLLGGSTFHAFDSGQVDSRQHAPTNRSLGDIAILYRTAAQAGPVVAALNKAGVPYQQRSHQRLRTNPAVSALLHEMVRESSVHNEATVAQRLTAAAQRLERQLSGIEPTQIWPAVDILTPIAERTGADIDLFCSEVAIDAEVDNYHPQAAYVSLLTLHAAKGLEFPIVFIVGCEDGLIPLRFASDDEMVDEERRLFFVGITRAQNQLFLSYARERSSRRGPGGRTPFLNAINQELLVSDAHENKRSAIRQLRLL